jgi:predicted glycosyltransferase
LTWQGYFCRLSIFNLSHYDIPRGSIGKAITNEFSNLFENVMERKCNFEKIIVFTQVLLQRENNVAASKHIKKHLKLRLDCWQSGKFKMLVETTEQAL